MISPLESPVTGRPCDPLARPFPWFYRRGWHGDKNLQSLQWAFGLPLDDAAPLLL